MVDAVQRDPGALVHKGVCVCVFMCVSMMRLRSDGLDFNQLVMGNH